MQHLTLSAPPATGIRLGGSLHGPVARSRGKPTQAAIGGRAGEADSEGGDSEEERELSHIERNPAKSTHRPKDASRHRLFHCRLPRPRWSASRPAWTGWRPNSRLRAALPASVDRIRPGAGRESATRREPRGVRRFTIRRVCSMLWRGLRPPRVPAGYDSSDSG
jgi:hypothetical protein